MAQGAAARPRPGARRRTPEAEALLALSRALDVATDLGGTARRVARELALALGVDMAGIYLAEADGAWLYPVAGHRVPGHLLEAFRQKPIPLRGHGLVEAALDHARPRWTGDAGRDLWADTPIGEHFRRRPALLLPLLQDAAPAGLAIGMWWRRRRPPSSGERRLAATLGRHAALVLNRARLDEESEHRRESAEALAEVARVISGSLDPEEVGARITDCLRRLLAVKAARLWQIVPRTGALGLVASTEGEAERGLEMPPGIGLSAVAMRQRAVVVSPDLLADPRVSLTDQVSGRIRKLGHRAAVVAPLLVKGEVGGVLTASAEAGRVFSRREIALVSPFADQAALALDNARAHAALAVHAERLDALARVSHLVSSSLDPEAVLGGIAGALVELTDAAVGTIWSADERERTLELVAASNPFLGDFPRRVIRYDQGMVGWVAAHRQRLHVPDVSADGRVLEAEWWRSRDLAAFLGIPVASGDALLAVLALAGPRPFARDPDLFSVLDAFAGHAAIALGNSRLYQEARGSAALLARERRALEMVAAGVALPRVLEELCRTVEELCPGALCSFLLLDPDGAHLRHAAAPGLPAAYCQAIDGLAIGPAAGSCGTAAFLRIPVVAADTSTDPRWSEYRALAGAHGLAACWSVPVLSSARAVLGTFAVYRRAPGEPGPAERALVDRVASLASIAVERSHEAEARTRLLDRVIAAQEEERARLARELHDETAQSLAALALGLDGLREAASVRAARRRAAELHQVARRALTEVRHMAWGLRPTVLDDHGLLPGIERFASVITERHGLAVEVRAEGMADTRLPHEVETALYRIAQEALSNVARHAQARSARVLLERSGSRAGLSVEDDGQGFDVGGALARARTGTALGLGGMRERATMLGGVLDIVSAPGRGTRVVVSIPIEEEEATRGQAQDPAG